MFLFPLLLTHYAITSWRALKIILKENVFDEVAPSGHRAAPNDDVDFDDDLL